MFKVGENFNENSILYEIHVLHVLVVGIGFKCLALI